MDKFSTPCSSPFQRHMTWNHVTSHEITYCFKCVAHTFLISIFETILKIFNPKWPHKPITSVVYGWVHIRINVTYIQWPFRWNTWQAYDHRIMVHIICNIWLLSDHPKLTLQVAYWIKTFLIKLSNQLQLRLPQGQW